LSEHDVLSIDLVMGTLGRTVALRRFLESLARQTCGHARLIVVDQNADQRLLPVFSEFTSDIPIVHLRSGVGLSRARNVGLRHVTADVVAFPDDDCWYPPELLERVTRFLLDHPELGGVHGRAVDEHERPSGGREILRPGELTRYNVWARVGSAMLFVRKHVVDAAGPFDEMLGIGSPGPWGGAEDLDFVLRCLGSGSRLYYDPNLLVYHPPRRERSSWPDPRDAYRYGMGVGSVLKTSRLPVWLAAWLCARGFLGALVELVRGRPAFARFYCAAGRGRMRGWLGPPRPRPRHAAESE